MSSNVFHKNISKSNNFQNDRRDGHPVAPTLSAQKALFEDCVLGGRGLPIPLYSGLGNPSSSLKPSCLGGAQMSGVLGPAYLVLEMDISGGSFGGHSRVIRGNSDTFKGIREFGHAL